MEEDGWEWDSEKKELKKIETKTLNVDKAIEKMEDMLHTLVGVVDKLKND